MNQLISIVIPVYNAEKFLEESIESCLNQTYPNFEIIAVNDGSTDHSPEILQSYSDKIRIVTQKNKGIAGAINSGIKEMTGNWFKLMNADDVLYSNCVQDLVSEINSVNNKKIIIFGHYDRINSEGIIINERVVPNRNDQSLFEQNVRELCSQDINCITTIIHKETFEKYGYYNESMKFAEDYEILIRLGVLYGFRYHLLDKKLAKYRVHDTQDSVRMKKTDPSYYKSIRSLILNQLDPSEKKRYEIAIKEYKKRNKISPILKTKLRLNSLLLKQAPTFAPKLSRMYRNVVKKKHSSQKKKENYNW